MTGRRAFGSAPPAVIDRAKLREVISQRKTDYGLLDSSNSLREESFSSRASLVEGTPRLTRHSHNAYKAVYAPEQFVWSKKPCCQSVECTQSVTRRQTLPDNRRALDFTCNKGSTTPVKHKAASPAENSFGEKNVEEKKSHVKSRSKVDRVYDPDLFKIGSSKKMKAMKKGSSLKKSEKRGSVNDSVEIYRKTSDRRRSSLVQRIKSGKGLTATARKSKRAIRRSIVMSCGSCKTEDFDPDLLETTDDEEFIYNISFRDQPGFGVKVGKAKDAATSKCLYKTTNSLKKPVRYKFRRSILQWMANKVCAVPMVKDR